MFELKREMKHGIETVQRGTQEECTSWMIETVKRNGYRPTTTVTLDMLPMWIMTDRVFWIQRV